jgi:putative membrane protein
MHRRRTGLLATAAAAAIAFGTTSAPALAHGDGGHGTRMSHLSQHDKAFLRDAARGAYAEVAGGQVAAKEGTTAEVRALGEHLFTDHSAELVALHALADKYGIHLPMKMSSEQKDEMRRVSRHSGLRFDEAFAEASIKDHRADIAKFRNEAKDASNRDVRAFAKATIPTLKMHLAMAKTADKAAEQARHDARNGDNGNGHGGNHGGGGGS